MLSSSGHSYFLNKNVLCQISGAFPLLLLLKETFIVPENIDGLDEDSKFRNRRFCEKNEDELLNSNVHVGEPTQLLFSRSNSNFLNWSTFSVVPLFVKRGIYRLIYLAHFSRSFLSFLFVCACRLAVNFG